MSSPSGRLRDLGLTLPQVSRPLGAYVPAVRHGDLVFTAGQLPLVDGELVATGRVGDGPAEVSVQVARRAAATAALNGLAAAADLAGGLDQVHRVIKVVGYVAAADGFHAHPSVIDGASDLLVGVLGDHGRHARSAIGAASLPLAAPVEVELVVEVV